MGMIRIEMSGSFPMMDFSTSADEGGHVMAIQRSIAFLSYQLSLAVIVDADLTKDGHTPHIAPLGHNTEDKKPNPRKPGQGPSILPFYSLDKDPPNG